MVPGEPPAPGAWGPGAEPTPGVTTLRRLPGAGVVYRSPEVGETWYDGDTVTVCWRAGDGAASVRFYFYGDRCSLGGKSRGAFEGIINGGMVRNTGEVAWKVPWLDGTSLNLRVAAFDEDGQTIAHNERKVRLLPHEFKDLPPTCIAITKRLQRLHYFKEGELKRMHIVSTAVGGYTTPTMRPGSHSRRRGAMGKVFYKARNPFSRRYRVHMPYWLGVTSTGSHGIHATSPNLYRRLGRPASHGCIRQHRADARVLYQMVPVGTPVYIF